MLRRALRAILFAIVTIALWTVARPAMAMPAPFCDDRGATSMAPEPTLVAPDLPVRRAHVTPACNGEDVSLGSAVVPGHTHAPVASSQAEPVLTCVAPTVASASWATCALPPTAQPCADGVTSALERPPRN
jgi:hypothetical protein